MDRYSLSSKSVVCKCLDVFTSLFIVFVILSDNCYATEKLNVCVSKECYSTAKHLKSNINPDVDPCEDFYEFACGGWRENHQIPLTEQAWNPFSVATNKVVLILRELLEARDDDQISQESSDPVSVQSAKLLYQSCMDNDQIEATGLKPLVEISENFGGWPLLHRYWKFNDFNWQNMYGDLIRILFFQPIIHIDVGTDFKNSGQHTIYVDQPSLVVLRQMLVSTETYSTQINAYKSFVKDVAEIFLDHYAVFSDIRSELIGKMDYDFHNRITSEIDEMIQFEINIAKIMSPPEMRRDIQRLYNKMTIRELQTWTDSAAAGSNDTHSKIDWLKIMRLQFKNTNITFDYDEKVVVREVNFLFKLVKLLQKTSLKTVANYLHWRLIEEYSTDLMSDIRKLHFQFRRIFTGAVEEHPRWKECVRSTQFAFGLALGYKYTQQYFDENSKKSAVEMVNNLVLTFHDQMDKVTWMDEKTKQAARDKISHMKRFIGYPDWFTNNITHLDDYYRGLKIGPNHFVNMFNARVYFNIKNLLKLRKPVDRNEWPIHEPPITVNAFYSPYMNAIIFPAAVLQPPFFSKGRPDALNYGGVGVVIGHEITHGFDDMGRQYDKYGNLAQWWTEHTISEHRNKTKCFVEQYSNFDVPELNELLFKHVKLNGLLTVGENMADNGGLRQAYLAYRRSIDAIKNHKFIDNVDDEFMFSSGKRFSSYKAIDIRLPGLEMFSNDQLFFLGFAWNWCETQTKESLLHEVLGNAHSPQKFRVLGSVANSAEFSKAFSCPVGSPMNPKNKCSFW